METIPHLITHEQIAAEYKIKMNNLLSKYKIFFAFSNQQFTESMPKLAPGDKIISLGAGAYMPKSFLDLYKTESKIIEKWHTDSYANNEAAKEDYIYYELQNYECFYTGNISDVVNSFFFTEQEVLTVYHKYKHLHKDF